MPTETATPKDSVFAVNEGFTQGGDLILRSTDGVNFSVHSVLLSLASSVFSELLTTGTKSEAIRFSETAEVLALMLKFIYPTPTSNPTVPSMGLLNDGMRVATKYQLNNMKNRLREQLSIVDSPVSAYANPIGALCVASMHGFTAEAELAASLASKRCDFGNGDDIKSWVDAIPDPAITALVKLAGIPLVKTRVLVDVLLHFERVPMSLGNNINALVCPTCRETFRNCVRQSPPEWQARWAHWIFDELKDRPISDWKPLFAPLNTSRAFYQTDLTPVVYSYKTSSDNKVCTCLGVIGDNANATALQNWVTGVYNHLTSRLSFIAEMETSQTQHSDPEGKGR
ncbi:hypothetical protein B0J17DRAFT_681864 [Rhizoctonia solani]|nr:hypothetical protein B0J17DRAFT_681864 [Rhizoctonia solani]